MFEIPFSQSIGLLAQNAAGNSAVNAAADVVNEAEPFISPGMIMFMILLGTIALGWFLGNLISKSLNVSDYGGRMAIVLIPILLAALMIGTKWPPKFGVDLRGGINMIGSLNLEALGDDGGEFGERPTAKDIIPNLIQRVNPSGTKEIMIRALGTDQIEVTIPSVNLQEADEIWDRLVKAGKLEFRIVANGRDNSAEFELAREMAAAGSRAREVKDAGGDIVARWTSLASEIAPPNDPMRLTAIKFVPGQGNLIRDKSTGRIINADEWGPYVSRDPEKQNMELAQWARNAGIRTLQILMLEPDEDLRVDGVHLANVRAGTDEMGRGSVNFETTDQGAGLLFSFTDIFTNRPMGIVLDDQLHSAPNINEAISRNGQIAGRFTPEEVQELVINLRSGKLEVALNKAPISKDFIESTLGQELKEKGIWAITASLLLVLVFMVIYYRFAGIVATVALVLNLILILALIMAINQPLTLTGLAGLVLTVGMSVDANVLIFERIREELDRGAALRMAIRNGFDKATTTIVDANVTTLITALVLYAIGTEQIKGFSVTLILGILMSMFTAIFCSRLLFDIAERRRWLTKLNMARLLSKGSFNFLNKVSLTGIVSAALIAFGLFSIFNFGTRLLNHDLRGGSTVRMVFNEAQDIEKLRDELVEAGVVHNDEKIEFTVSGFKADEDKPELANRIFKVDSSLPAWEGGAEETRFEQLDELLSRLFKGRLELHHVDIEGANSGPANNESSSLNEKRGSALGNQAAWVSVPAAVLFPRATSLFLIQDEGDAPAEAPKPETAAVQSVPSVENGAGPEATTEDSNVDSAEPGQLNADSLDLDSVPEDKPVAAPKELADLAPAEGEVKVSRELKFAQPISGKTLRSLLVEASRKSELQLDLEEAQIEVDSDDVRPDDSPLSTLSKNWTVTMEVQRKGDAARIIDAWSGSFNEKPYFPTISKVGGQIARKTQLQALAAIVASLVGIIAYIWIRFQNIAFGLAAVIALIHDVLIVLGAIAISHWLAGSLGFLKIDEFKISLEIVAALLTVIGYSLNDTIVVFDRIREVRGKRTEITADMINDSISQTLSRTILTSLTTFIVVFILYWFGGDAIHGFAFALVVGVIVGTYSSIFVASPSLLWLMNTVGLNPGVVDPAAE